MDKPNCSVDGCDRQRAYTNGMCGRCWQRWYKTGSTDAPSNVRKCGHERTPENTIFEANGKRRCRPCREAYKASHVSAETCSAEGCDRPVTAKGLCNRDYQRMKAKGSTEDRVLMTPEERKQSEAGASARWYRRNTEVIREKSRAAYLANREAALERSHRWYEANKEKVAADNRAWRLANPGRASALFREWTKANPEKAAMRNRANVARRRVIIGSPDPVNYQHVLAEHGMVCHICTEGIGSLADLHFDHVIPLARGGRHTPGNIRPSHAACNLRKGAKLMSELLATEGG